MSDLLQKVLCGETEVDEIVRWLLINDITVLKEEVNSIEFARYLLEFLRKHTRLLLPAQDLPSNAANTTDPGTPTAKPANTSTPITHRVSTPSDSRSATPISTKKTPGNSRTRNPFSPTGNCSPISREMPACSSNSMELLEKRLTSKEDSPRTAGKTVPLMSFLVHKDKQSKRRRVKPVRCDPNDQEKEVHAAESSNGPTRMKILSRSNRNESPAKVESVPCNSMNVWELKEKVRLASIDNQNKQSPSPNSMKRVQLMDENVQPAPNDDQNLQSTPQKSVQSTDADLAMQEQTIDFTCDIRSEHKTLILKLALLYSAVITANLIQDLLKELTFLISLLTSTVKLDSVQYTHYCSSELVETIFHPNTKEIGLFKTAVEGAYFAVVVLEMQWDLLKLLGKSMVSLFAQNKSLVSFAPEFAARIRSFIEKDKSSHKNVNILDREMLNETVKFQMDTDCRPNYANDQSFCAFKKQRDEFYSLLQDWKSSQRPPPVEFLKARQKRLRPIFTSSSASSNMFRLANLFVSQIFASVFNEDFESCESLLQKGVAMTKFDSLNRRFVTPSSIVVGNDKRFPGVQEFFIEFLRSSESLFFLSHVRDVLVQRIVALNNQSFSGDVSVALERQERFLVCINELCLLAKFLSWINFLPYQDKDSLPLHLRIPLAEARKHVLPPLDLDGLLTDAIQSGRMLITIPWIVEFLNGIDETSIQLPFYNVLFVKLQYLLYKIKLPSDSSFENVFVVCSEDVKKLLVEANAASLGVSSEDGTKMNRISISEIRHLAAITKHNFTKRFVDECVRTFDCSRILITLYVNSLFNNVSVSTIIKRNDIRALVRSPILIVSELYIDDKALYQCCPQLNDIKSLLDCGRKQSYRSVPTKTAKAISERQSNKVAVELQLEMHFFDNMPQSVKYAVEFVAKQVSSHCENSLREKIIPELKSKLSERLKSAGIQERQTDEMMESMLAEFYSILRRGVQDELSRLYSSIECALRGILKPDVKEDQQIFDICVNVTCKKCIEITFNWISNYINFNVMIEEVKKTVTDDIDRTKSATGKAVDEKKTKKNKVCTKKLEFDRLVSLKDQAGLRGYPAPVKILHRLRHMIRVVIARSCIPMGSENLYSMPAEPLTSRDVETVIADSIKCIEHRTDLQFIAFRRILMLSLDLAHVLVFFEPDLVVDSLLSKFGNLWAHRKDCNLHLPFEQILSLRNVGLCLRIPESRHANVLKTLDKFLCFTINGKIMHVSKLFREMLKLLQHDWPDEKLVTRIFGGVKETLKTCNVNNEKILNAIESIAYFGEEVW